MYASSIRLMRMIGICSARYCLPFWRKSNGNFEERKIRLIKEFMATTTCEPPKRSAPPPEAESGAAKRCRRCHRVLAIGQFRFHYRRQGIRHRECNKCAREIARERRIRDRNGDIYEFLTETRRAQTAEALAAMIEEMIGRYHGVRRFAQRWYEAAEAARESGRTATALRSFVVLTRVMATHEELSPKAHELSDDELAARADQSVIRLIEQHPEVAVRACRRLGWQVTPMPEGDSNQEKDGV